MKRNYKLIIYTYIALQLSVGIGIELTAAFLRDLGLDELQVFSLAFSIWPVVSFSLAMIAILLLLRPEFQKREQLASSMSLSILWGIAGVFLAIGSQLIAVQIEFLLGVEPGSNNTEEFIKIIQHAPLFIIVTTILGPVLEEIVFRKVIFGTLFKKYNFWISAIISSLIFSIAHMEFEHILLYAAMGMTFAFLYAKTKRIIVPIISHVLMNSMVIIGQIATPELQETIQGQLSSFL